MGAALPFASITFFAAATSLCSPLLPLTSRHPGPASPPARCSATRERGRTPLRLASPAATTCPAPLHRLTRPIKRPPRRSSAPQPPPPPLALSQATQRRRRTCLLWTDLSAPFQSKVSGGKSSPRVPQCFPPPPLTATMPLGRRPSATHRPLPPAVVARPPRAASGRAAAGDRTLPPPSLFSLTPEPLPSPRPPAQGRRRRVPPPPLFLSARGGRR